METRLRPPRYLIPFEARRLPHVFTDVLVIGSGAAGLRASIEASGSREVLLLAKRARSDTNTNLAQGGIAAALGAGDSPQDHGRDTIAAGQGLCDPEVVDQVTREGPDRIRELEAWGARFDRSGDLLALAREGGHSIPRLARAGGDSTGAEIQEVLLRRASEDKNIRLQENVFVVDLLTDERRCVGALVLTADRILQVVRASATVLCTGGAGRLWRETTNPTGACGDGLAMAYRAGARLRDMEFMQFHPTALYLAGASRFLISEAARGEGGLLLDRNGRRFMPSYHEKAELAPRDAVSRAIAAVIRETEANCVYLDLRHLDPEIARTRFPAIAAHLGGYGIHLSKDLIPVRPSAHYMIGGVATDLSGATGVAGLFAAGEVASTGLHGANRLGSNSLLEAIVFGRRAGESAAREAGDRPASRAPLDLCGFEPSAGRSLGEIHFKDLENSLESLMWRSVGLERNESDLLEALEKISFWSGYVMPRRFHSGRGMTLQNMLQVARMIARGALRRKESRGVHFRTDHPTPDPAWARPNEVEHFENGI